MISCTFKYLKKLANFPGQERHFVIICFVTSARPARRRLKTLARSAVASASTSFQRLTNCLKFATHFEGSLFQSLPAVKFSNPFVLITMQIAGGVPPVAQQCLRDASGLRPAIAGVSVVCHNSRIALRRR
jgi:hypothetical protein